MEPTQVFKWLTEQAWWQAVTTTIALAAVLASITPTQYDNIALQWARKLLDFVAFNVANAKNAK